MFRNLLVILCALLGNSLSAKTNAPPVVLDSAVTRDANGNGYLDEIELYFNSQVVFPPGFSPANITVIDTFVINNRVAVPFVVDSFVPLDASGMNYVLHLEENPTSMPASPQTALRPYVSIVGMENNSSVPPTQCKDGAGPVIWSVTKTVVNVSDRKQDVVKVTFSEPIQGPNGAQFAITSVSPGLVFVDYRKNADGTWDTLDMFSNINSFSRMVNDSTLEFVMSNGKDLTTVDYLNINTAAHQIYDKQSPPGGGAGVAPEPNNRNVQVRVINTGAPGKFTIVPNPSKPICTRESAGEFHAQDNPNARNWVREDGAGVVFSFGYIPDTPGIQVTVKIFDSYNTLIASASGVIGNFFDTNNSTMKAGIYWNGTTSNGELSHEGFYSVQMQLLLPHQTKTTTLQENFYLTKPDSGHSTCGGNYSIAFLPAIWLKTRKPLLRFVKTLLKKTKQSC